MMTESRGSLMRGWLGLWDTVQRTDRPKQTVPDLGGIVKPDNISVLDSSGLELV